MAIWKEQTSPKTESGMTPPSTPSRLDDVPSYSTPASSGSSYRSNGAAMKESLIAAELTIEGKIEGAGHIRMAGNFKGDVNVDGNLTIEYGAKVTGSVRAQTVVIAGELEGNIDAASRVELLETGVLNGDLRAGSLIVAGGSRMRGQVSFGWNEVPASNARTSTATSIPAEEMEMLATP